MKVLLINPHQTSQGGFSNAPLGLLYLAGTLKKNDIEVNMVDGYLVGFEGIRAKIDEYKPDIIGITCYTPGRHKTLQIASYTRSRYPKTMIVVGGAHPTIMWNQLLSAYDFIDACGLGEGEMTMLEITQGKKFKDIEGIAYRENGKPKMNKPREYFENLDDVPLPAWELCEFDKYPGQPGFKETRGEAINISQARIPLVTSRGCTGDCSFCSTWWIWRGYRHRSGKNVVDEIEALYKAGYKHFVFEDDAMTLDRQPVIDMCDEIIKRDLKIAFFCTTRVDALDLELATKLKEAGCYELTIGVESGSPKILKTIGKHIDLKQSKKAIDILHQVGIKSGALIMVGNVGETDETINETVRFLKESGVDGVGSLGAVWVLPGTRLYFYCKKKGYLDDSFWLSEEQVYVFKEGFDERQLQKWTKAIYEREYV